MSSIFEPALHELELSGRAWSQPMSFQSYLKKHGLSARSTAACISVQSLESLDPALRAAGVMVLRLGVSPDGTTTQFGLVRAPRSIDEFFLRDKEIFTGKAETFVPDAHEEALLSFKVLKDLTEGGAMNLAIASGLLGYALGLDEPFPRIAPATAASVFTFSVRPHAQYEALWMHNKGQVKIDALVFGRRRGERCLFVIEAKHGPLASLSKHRLAYAIAAIGTKPLPADVRLVPVYMRSWQEDDGRLRYAIVECESPESSSGMAEVASLEVRAAKALDLLFS